MDIPFRFKGLDNGGDIGNGNGALAGNDIDGAMDHTQRKITASGLCYGLFVNGVPAAAERPPKGPLPVIVRDLTQCPPLDTETESHIHVDFHDKRFDVNHCPGDIQLFDDIL